MTLVDWEGRLSGRRRPDGFALHVDVLMSYSVNY